MQAHRRAGAALAAAIAAAVLGGAAASAQSDARESVAGCRALPTEAERLDCMEKLVLDLSPAQPASGEPQIAPAPAAAEPSPAAAPAATKPDREPEAYGAEQLQARERESRRPQPMTARVVAFEEIPVQRLRVELDNGQVWEQRDGVPPWREEQYGAPDEVEITPSRFGGYRMRLLGRNLTLAVERVR